VGTRSKSSSTAKEHKRSPKVAAKRELQKKRILATAAEAFLKSGFEQTRTEEIARRAKVSKRELYTHFADKRALLAAVVVEHQREMQARMDLRWSSTKSLAAVLEDAAQEIRDFILSEMFGKLLRVVISESFRHPELAIEFFECGPNRGRVATARFLEAQMALGRLRKADPLKAADDFLNLVIGGQLVMLVMLGWTNTVPKNDPHVRHAVEVFLNIYGTEPPAHTNRAEGGIRNKPPKGIDVATSRISSGSRSRGRRTK